MNESEQKNKTENLESIQKIQNWYVVWLGNAGKKYTTTRHNAAWIIAHNEFSKSEWKEHKYSPTFVYEQLKQHGTITHMCPLTLMNHSGQVLNWFAQKQDLTHKNIIVIHDDYHLPMGTIKISHNRGDAGHNGVASVTRHIKTKNYTRIRIGIGEHPEYIPLEKYVLMPFSSYEVSVLEKQSARVFQMIQHIIVNGVESAMNQWNGK